MRLYTHSIFFLVLEADNRTRYLPRTALFSSFYHFKCYIRLRSIHEQPYNHKTIDTAGMTVTKSYYLRSSTILHTIAISRLPFLCIHTMRKKHSNNSAGQMRLCENSAGCWNYFSQLRSTYARKGMQIRHVGSKLEHGLDGVRYTAGIKVKCGSMCRVD